MTRGGRAHPGPAALRRIAALLGLAWMLAPALAPAALPSAQVADLARIEAYLNDLGTLRSDFVQINPDGAKVTGELYYQRPDKMRLDYDPPSDILIISDGWWVIYYDRKLDQVSHLTIGSTPLGFLLADHIRLSGDVTVTDLTRENGELKVTLIQTDEPNQGSIQLAFAEDPLELRRWTVRDAQGQATYVVLNALQTGIALDKELFRFRNPQFYPDARN
ncbi:MAG TPA: outer membrane lipoprotein carrier protein LolA [Geminicoccaceae bacterium]|nr:outer membrane lipoprotein carrier protein LolA [Geminicoccaceae bacterium]